MLLRIEYIETENGVKIGKEIASIGRDMLMTSIRNRVRFYDTKDDGMLVGV